MHAPRLFSELLSLSASPNPSSPHLDLEDFLTFLTLAETLHLFYRQPYPAHLPKRRALFLAGELIPNIYRSPPLEIPTIGAVGSAVAKMNAYYRMTALIHLNFAVYCSSPIQCEHFLAHSPNPSQPVLSPPIDAPAWSPTSSLA